MGYIELMVSLEERRDTKIVKLQFLVVPYRSACYYIMGSIFPTTLDAISSSIHLMLKYHNVYDEPVMVCLDISGVRRIHKALQSDGEERTRRRLG